MMQCEWFLLEATEEAETGRNGLISKQFVWAEFKQLTVAENRKINAAETKRNV